ncbi:type I-G CRISPR-associated helicase/endonuclease Cas3g [Klugiella xanthotipulae]|uniref:CRISPR-associated endonuclease/helicase Cas3 n=1 Tax=Klugiella xanthotipulae TaxID=244735 RepID=A0A543I5Y0_9MICO|nr:type I-U CRISPR-associated helicase/endonuclease Cas3 [Klugiella xanthotipulae]TQM65987.1 CRISPR-associated endonuclease/helicase Cas3 [Klugiella xanthotipulae]
MNKSENFPQFDEFFRALHGGTEPYLWQQELAVEIATEQSWPGQVAIPTGLGKTSTVALAVYELARDCYQGGPRTAPQRIFHVVDRRTVIDSTALYMKRIADCINQATAGPLLPVKMALDTLVGPGDNQTVVVARVHGESPDDYAWMRSSGCVLVSLTAHQFVSRLLLRGFGVGTKVRSIAAGLCGIDRLVLFDEPHLSVQSVSTILDTERLQREAPHDLGLPHARTVLLGATLPSTLDELDRRTFELTDEQQKDPAVTKRVQATRELSPVWCTGTDSGIEKELIAQAQAAWSRGAERVVVFANTVDVAQGVYRALVGTAKNVPGAQSRIELVTSRFRPMDRLDRKDGNSPNKDADTAIPEGPLTVVATQTLEVGVDVTFDALVTESCSWSALVQRCGRLNRDGSAASAQGVVVCGWDSAHAQPILRKATGLVYGEEPVERLISLLHVLDAESAGSPIDWSVAGLKRIQARDGFDASTLQCVPPRVGTVHRAMLPLLAQTNPTPNPDVPLNALIAGPDARPTHEISILWRHDYEAVDVVGPRLRPHNAEQVSITRAAFAAFLFQKPKLSGGMTDVDGLALSEPVNDVAPQDRPVVSLERIRVWDGENICWCKPTKWSEVLRAPKVILPHDAGGYTQELGWTGKPETVPVSDMAVTGGLAHIRRIAGNSRYGEQRVDVVFSEYTLGEMILDAPYGESVRGSAILCREECEELSGRAPDDDVDLEPLKNSVAAVIRTWLTSQGLAPEGWAIAVDAAASPYPIAVAQVRKVAMGNVAGDCSLESHQRQVAQWSRGDGRAAGLSESLVEQVGFAGLHHDDGKMRPEFQAFLRRKDGESFLAKSDPGQPRSKKRRRLDWMNAGLEQGWRHEAVTTLAALILERHLIGSHHGWFRPILQPIPGAPAVAEGIPYPDPLAHADDFAFPNAHYGVWGLAYLEAVLRLADWRASATPQNVAESDEWTRSGRPRVTDPGNATITVAESIVFAGLSTHPVTGWFAVMGLLSTSERLLKGHASVRWEPLEGAEGGAPLVPVLRTTFSAHDLVHAAFSSDMWDDAQRILEQHGVSKLGIKNQKLSPAHQLRPLLLAAEEEENSLLLGLVNDLERADASGKVPLSIPAIANNASYSEAALLRITPSSRDQAAEAAVSALFSPNAGFAYEQCDGGMDRFETVNPAVNGLSRKGGRASRNALAPLVLVGIAAFGSGFLKGVGISQNGGALQLPFPTVPLRKEEMRALVYLGSGPKKWDWDGSGLEWVYEVKRERPTQYDHYWKGALYRRGSDGKSANLP